MYNQQENSNLGAGVYNAISEESGEVGCTP